MAIVLGGKRKDLEGFSVTRILPHADKRMVGPFIFLDHMGPAEFDAGDGIDVRPHPHIGLATITYLLEGAMLHRDSLGNNVEITPGDVNWMTAGCGIVHSERETHETKASTHRLNGIQCWVALPEHCADIAPSFCHHNRASLPYYIAQGVQARLIVGEAYGLTSPIKTYSPMFYLDVTMKAGASVARPNPDQECAVYVIYGEIDGENASWHQGDFVLLDKEQDFTASSNSRVLLLGGKQWDKVPHMFWNFVSFDREKIEQTKLDWREQKFPAVPGDCSEFTPLP